LNDKCQTIRNALEQLPDEPHAGKYVMVPKASMDELDNLYRQMADHVQNAWSRSNAKRVSHWCEVLLHAILVQDPATPPAGYVPVERLEGLRDELHRLQHSCEQRAEPGSAGGLLRTRAEVHRENAERVGQIIRDHQGEPAPSQRAPEGWKKQLLDQIVPAIQDDPNNPIDPVEHCCEFAVKCDRDRIRRELLAAPETEDNNDE